MYVLINFLSKRKFNFIVKIKECSSSKKREKRGRRWQVMYKGSWFLPLNVNAFSLMVYLGSSKFIHHRLINLLKFSFAENGEAVEECKKIEEMWFEIDVNLDVIPLLETLFNKAGQTLKLIELLLSWTVQLIMSHKLDQM